MTHDKNQPKYVQLTNKTLRVGTRVYPLRNVTNIDIKRLKPNYTVSMKTIILSCFLGALLISIESIALIGVLPFLIVIYGILERILKKVTYALILETSSASKTLVSSPDKGFMEQLVSKIYEVMNHEDMVANYVFNMEDKSINVAGDIGGHAISGDVQNSF